MERGKPLKRTPLTRSSSLSRAGKLAGVSAKGRARKQAQAAQVAAEGAAFKAAIRGMRCVMCGRTENEAYEQTGYGADAHHPVPQKRLKSLGRTDLLWSPDWATPLCVSPCHARQTARMRGHVVPWEKLPPRVIAFAAENGLSDALLKEHPRGGA
jgi:hypothetical protein